MQKVQILAMHLPQYHEIPENNEWWGKGFTEWTNVKKAKPLYEGHFQPRIPLNNNYYDLGLDNTIHEQMKMAKKYGVGGFCFYHYWFNGKKLLEKPIEALINCNEIELPFCLCWANEPWTRTWDGVNGSKQMLMEQHYGGKEDWKKHFEYLLCFFLREEYIKVKNKPVFIIYKENEIDDVINMLDYWDELAKISGFDGMYIINTMRQPTKMFFPNYSDAYFDFEPFATQSNLDKQEILSCNDEISIGGDKKLLLTNYDMFCKKMSERFVAPNMKHYLGMFVGFDNTPRRGDNAGRIFVNNSPDVFEKYFRIQMKRSYELNNEFLFINAWNEWGEGTYLEPDTKYGFKYLEAIRRTVDEFDSK